MSRRRSRVADLLKSDLSPAARRSLTETLRRGEGGGEEGGPLLVVLPIPPKDVGQNARPSHPMARHRAVLKARGDAHEAAAAALAARPDLDESLPWSAAVVDVEWFRRCGIAGDPTNRRDKLKPAVDGLRDAGVLLDDDRTDWGTFREEIDGGNPRIVLHVRPVPDPPPPS